MGETFEPGSWNVEMEVNLFHAMRGHKPVGVNRHFHMVVIHEKLSSPTTKKLSAKDVWDHLSTMYDLQALNESEILPFPNKPLDFKLPANIYKLSDDTDFPRMQNVGIASSSEETKAKPEGQAKGGKASRSDSKATHLSKVDSKGNLADSKGSSSKADSKSSTPESKSSHTSKADSKSGGSSSSGKAEGKGGGKGGHSSSAHLASSTPDPSPKRTKRTRHNHSATNSPASDAPPTKRRR
ncbi:uncharacterized protein LOC143294662 isoform X2 [Babylonia areolata]